MIAAAARTAIQVQQNRGLKADDYTLIFGCITFIASTVLVFILLPITSWFRALTQTSADSSLAFSSSGFPEKLLHYQQILFAYIALSWATIFSVKITFILFFRPIVNQLPRMLRYWKITLVVTLLSFSLSVCDIYLGCPHFGLAALGKSLYVT